MHDPPHPGEILRDTVLGDGRLSVSEFARKLGVSRVALSRVVNCRAAVSADMALRLAAALGGSAESWLHMQASHDLWHAKARFVGSDKRPGDVARKTKRLLRESFRGK